jgi:hypothetical protein
VVRSLADVAILPRRYDAFVYLVKTQAGRPLKLEAGDEGEVPETYPNGV